MMEKDQTDRAPVACVPLWRCERAAKGSVIVAARVRNRVPQCLSPPPSNRLLISRGRQRRTIPYMTLESTRQPKSLQSLCLAIASEGLGGRLPALYLARHAWKIFLG